MLTEFVGFNKIRLKVILLALKSTHEQVELAFKLTFNV